jgi:hypothetical protein
MTDQTELEQQRARMGNEVSAHKGVFDNKVLVFQNTAALGRGKLCDALRQELHANLDEYLDGVQKFMALYCGEPK